MIIISINFKIHFTHVIFIVPERLSPTHLLVEWMESHLLVVEKMEVICEYLFFKTCKTMLRMTSCSFFVSHIQII